MKLFLRFVGRNTESSNIKATYRIMVDGHVASQSICNACNIDKQTNR